MTNTAATHNLPTGSTASGTCQHCRRTIYLDDVVGWRHDMVSFDYEHKAEPGDVDAEHERRMLKQIGDYAVNAIDALEDAPCLLRQLPVADAFGVQDVRRHYLLAAANLRNLRRVIKAALDGSVTS